MTRSLTGKVALVERGRNLMVLLGGDAGVRPGEIGALEWRDINLAARRLSTTLVGARGPTAGR
jgi:integrase